MDDNAPHPTKTYILEKTYARQKAISWERAKKTARRYFLCVAIYLLLTTSLAVILLSLSYLCAAYLCL